LWVVADSFFLFVVARAVGGLSKANVSLATAVMADVTETSTRTKAMVSIRATYSTKWEFSPNNDHFLLRQWLV